MAKGFKAFFLSLLTDKADAYPVSSIPEKSLRGLFVKPLASIEAALKRAFQKSGTKPVTYIPPVGDLVLRWVEKEQTA